MFRNIIKFTESTVQSSHFPNFYITKYQNLHDKLKEQENLLKQLRLQKQLIDIATTKTQKDFLMQISYKLMQKEYQTSAMKKLTVGIKDLRNQLQDLILESDRQWESPRKQIQKNRKKIHLEFVNHLFGLEKVLSQIQTLTTQSADLEQGTNLTYRMLMNLLAKHYAYPINPEIGTKFDQEKHETDNPEKDNTEVIEVLSKGWYFENELVKKAIVKVQKKVNDI